MVTMVIVANWLLQPTIILAEWCIQWRTSLKGPSLSRTLYINYFPQFLRSLSKVQQSDTSKVSVSIV